MFCAGAEGELPGNAEVDAAKAEYDESNHDEPARVSYLTKLAKIRERHLEEYWRGSDRSEEDIRLAQRINEEFLAHPASPDADAKKLSHLLVGKWQSPRHIYIFRADRKCGFEDGPVDTSWRISGNQLIEAGSPATIILIDDNYFIYADTRAADRPVFFHVRVTESADVSHAESTPSPSATKSPSKKRPRRSGEKIYQGQPVYQGGLPW